jgi:ABC-type multidrug transport system fused ATPase/permease subunit
MITNNGYYLYQQFIQYSKKNKWLRIGLFLSIVGTLLYDILSPFIFRILFNYSLPNKSLHSIRVLISLLVLLFIVDLTARLLCSHFACVLSDQILRKIRTKLYCAQIIKGQNFIAQLTEDVACLETIFCYTMWVLLGLFIISCLSFFLLIYINWRLASFIFILSLAIFSILLMINRKANKLAKVKRKGDSSLMEMVIEAYTMHDLIKYLLLKTVKREQFQGLLLKNKENNLSYNSYLNLIAISSVSSINILIISTLIASILLIIYQKMMFGDLVAFMMVLTNITASIDIVSSHYPSFAKGTIALKRINQSIKNYNPYVVTENVITSFFFHQKSIITFNDVSISHKKNTILDSVSLKIKYGQKVLIIGPNGAGKTSLLKAFMAELPLASGQILIDDIPLQQFDKDTLYKHICYIPQTPMLFQTTISDNIRMGKIDATMNEIINAAKLSHAHDFIVQLPEGYDTKIDFKYHLSGGQMQRIAIARALIRKPNILCLDEVTNNLDKKSTLAIEQMLFNLPSEITVIIVTHHLYLASRADEVFVLKKGRMIQREK